MNLPTNFNQVEINLHKAVQLISLTGVNLQKPLQDDSQNTSIWDEKSNTILGRKFELNRKQYQIGIRLSPFELMLFDKNRIVERSIVIAGQDHSSLYSLWSGWLKNLGFKEKLKTKLHYDLPKEERYDSPNFNRLTPAFVQAWIKLRTMANRSLVKLNNFSGIDSEINIWPHHFDTGVFYAIKDTQEKTTHAIGAGLAIADSLINEPYFYLYGWSIDGSIDYSNATKLPKGKWLTGDWKGAVLKSSEITTEEETIEFFETSYNYTYNQLK